MYVCVFVAVVLVGLCGCAEKLDEAGCVQMSKYDYDYKMLKQMIKLETENEQLRDRLATTERLLGEVSSKLDEIDDMKRTLEMLAAIERTAGGAAYIRFGQDSCPGNGTELVYPGYVAGSYYDHSGAASNHLCLPNDPQYDMYRSGFQTEGRIYGAEYYMANPETFFRKDLQYHVPKCAVCRSSRSSVVMIPARTTCYDGWTKEFGGYLVSGHYGHTAATEYICMDKNASFTEWSKPGAQYGRLLYMVEGDCGHNINCPPYESAKEFTCVVCSR